METLIKEKNIQKEVQATKIHKTAIVHPKAKLGKGVQIGPFAVINANVTLGQNVIVGNFCVIAGNTTIGDDCQFFTGAVIGSIPQDKKFRNDENTSLIIGQNNIFREYMTVNHGTGMDGKTVIGNNNLFMAYAHIAHDCIIGNNCTFANNGSLAGHVIVEDMAVVGGLAAVHQFVRLGKLSIIGGCSKAVQDIPPFSTCDGHPTRVYGLNAIGLKRAKIPLATINHLKKAFKIFFYSGLLKKTAIEKVKQECSASAEMDHLLSFMADSKRGVCSSSRYPRSNNVSEHF